MAGQLCALLVLASARPQVGAFHRPIAAAAEAIAERDLSARRPVLVVEVPLVYLCAPSIGCEHLVGLVAAHVEKIKRSIPGGAAAAIAPAGIVAVLAVALTIDATTLRHDGYSLPWTGRNGRTGLESIGPSADALCAGMGCEETVPSAVET